MCFMLLLFFLDEMLTMIHNPTLVFGVNLVIIVCFLPSQ